MRRRHLLASMGALATPSIARAQGSQVLRFVPRTGLALLDPVWTTETATRAYALAVFESLYSVDEKLTPHPQMAAGHTIDDDGKRWTVRLRDGLRFHDNQPVLAARLRRLDRPVPAARLRRLDRPVPAARLRRLDRPVDEARRGRPHPGAARRCVGGNRRSHDCFPPSQAVSAIAVRAGQGTAQHAAGHAGPFGGHRPIAANHRGRRKRPVPVRGERVLGGKSHRVDAVRRVPAARRGTQRHRRRPACENGTDRVARHARPRHGRERPAESRGRLDRNTPPDLLGRLRQNRGVVVDICDPHGNYPLLRPNHVSGPTANVGIRRAIMAALDPKEIMQAATGSEPGTATAPVGTYLPGSPSDSRAGMERLGPKPAAEIRAMLQRAGYANKRLVLLHPTDFATTDAMLQVIAGGCRKRGSISTTRSWIRQPWSRGATTGMCRTKAAGRC